MPVSFSVKNVPDEVAEALRVRARRNHRSLQGELMAVLEAATLSPAMNVLSPLPSEVREPASAWGPEPGPSATPAPPSPPPPVKGDEFGRMLSEPAIAIPHAKIAEFCHRWRITEFSLFGSVLRDDFRPDSDIDVLVRFEPDAPWSLFDLGDMQAELGEIFGRKVDLVEKETIEKSRNPFRRAHILDHHRVIYAA